MARCINESSWMNESAARKDHEKGHEPQGSMMLAYRLIRAPVVR